MKDQVKDQARLFSVVAAAALALGGCAMPDSSNPTLTLNSAQVRGDSAELVMTAENPSDHDLTLEAVNWELIYGPLPVAQGRWEVNEPLPSKGSLRLQRSVSFQQPPLDRRAQTMELGGDMELRGKMTGASFAAESPVDR